MPAADASGSWPLYCLQVRRRRYFENAADAKKRKSKESRIKAKRCACGLGLLLLVHSAACR